jgi:hypothetical protein
MQISVQHNYVYLRDVDLGDNFSNIRADVKVNGIGRVKIYTKNKLLFDTKLKSLPNKALVDISNIREKKEGNNFLKKIKKRANAILINSITKVLKSENHDRD